MILTKEHMAEIRALMVEGSLDLDSDKALTDALYTIDALTQTIAELKTEIAELSDPNWKGTALLWQREVCNALGIQTSDRDTVLSAIAELTAKLDAVRVAAKEFKHGVWKDDCDADELAEKLLSILDAPTKPKEARNVET